MNVFGIANIKCSYEMPQRMNGFFVLPKMQNEKYNIRKTVSLRSANKSLHIVFACEALKNTEN